MRILFVAPGIHTPYTEGRKRFVLDLLTEMSTEDDIFLLTTRIKDSETNVPVAVKSIKSGRGARPLFHLLKCLPGVVREFNPDHVLLFPYGTFRHVYGLASLGFMMGVDKICQHYGVRCHTILYSVDEYGDIDRISGRLSDLVVVSNPSQERGAIHLGLNCHNWPTVEVSDSDGLNLLFLAGMWEPNVKRVEHVIQVRGLGQLLAMGNILSKQGVRLIAAAPLFASATCRDYVRHHKLNTWPEENLILRAEVDVPAIYFDADMFVFPYAREIRHFIPTSILESMLSGTCVALSNCSFLQPLSNSGKTAFVFPLNQPEKAAKILLDALCDSAELKRKADNARQWVLNEWCVERSANQIRSLLR